MEKISGDMLSYGVLWSYPQ